MAASPPLPAPLGFRRRPRRRAGMVVGAGFVVVLSSVLAACGGPDALVGTVVTAGRQGKPAQPLAGGRLAVLDDNGLRDFLGAAGIDTPPEAETPYLAGRVRRDDVTRVGGSLVTIDDKGEFTLVTTGRRTICLLLETPDVDVLRGCVVLDLPARGRLTLTLTADGLQSALEK